MGYTAALDPHNTIIKPFRSSQCVCLFPDKDMDGCLLYKNRCSSSPIMVMNAENWLNTSLNVERIGRTVQSRNVRRHKM